MTNKTRADVLKKIKPSAKKSLLSPQTPPPKTVHNKISSQSRRAMPLVRPPKGKSISKYREIIEDIQESIFEVDLTGKFTFLNDSVCRSLGYSRKKLIGMDSRRFTDKNDVEKVRQAYKNVFKTQKPIRKFGWHITRKDGMRRYIEGSIYLRKNSSGRAIGFRVTAYDFTERIKMEEALRQSEEKYRTILENIQDGYFEMDLTGNYTFFNAPLCQIHGYSREELLGMNNRRYTTPETAKKVFRTFNNIYKTGEPLKKFDYQIVRKDGAIRYIEASVSLLKDYSGRATGFRGIIRDITDRKEAEYQRETFIETLLRSEKYFKEITDNFSDILLITDKNGYIKYCSRSVERFTGYKPEELIGTSAFSFIHPDEIKQAVDIYSQAVLADNTVLIPNSFRIIRKDGSVVHLEGLGRNLLNHPDVAGFVMNVRDVTERKTAEEKLRIEEQRFRALAEQSSEIIVLVNRDGMITYENPAIEKALGYKAKDRIGHPATDLVHPDDRKTVNEAFAVLFSNPSTPIQKAEIRLRHRDGGWRTFDAVGSNLIHDDVIEFAIINLHDITDRKKAEHALQESRHKYRELSMIDDLTQLYNSRQFYLQLKKEIGRSNRYGLPLTLMLMDLDRFKAYNDEYGHVEGDHVLVRFGKVIKRCLRDSDSAYRYGGEEFTIMLPMTSCEEGIVIAKRIQMELEKEEFAPLPGQKVFLTVSIGLSQYKSEEEIKAFVHRVDQLMYKVKKNGRGRICCEDGIFQ